MAVVVGTKHEQTLPVTPEIAVSFLGPEQARVLGTPFLIYNLEITARNLVLPQLEAGFDTVGTRVDVRHLAATPLGMKVKFEAEVIAVEGRLIRFRVAALDELETVAEGLHERTVVNVSRFAQKVEAKRLLRYQSAD